MVIFCPNIGVLTSSVLALIPLVRPYAWQSLLLPVLPATEQMLDFLQVRSTHSDFWTPCAWLYTSTPGGTPAVVMRDALSDQPAPGMTLS